jgi:two-component system sensor histidine kinase KdpD
MAERDSDHREGRPSPDALLAQAERDQRGKLKIFLGAAPGVGKTFEMLLSGRAKRAEGVDAVIGVVETHGRVETAKLLEGLEIVPRRAIDYRGQVLDEMDLDAILARRPALVLVDELAHTNAPGSRHPKRYLDVEEILKAGIDVYSTLNVQHLESLNDVVARITRIRVRETVPDGVLDRADEIEVIDVTPETLMERLRDGKVYVREQAQRALKHYFSAGNLTALRELALRRTAQRVDEQMLDYMQAHAIEGPWPAGDRVLVCISEDPSCANLIRYARRVAERLRAPWTGLYVESDRHLALNPAQIDQVAEHMRLIEHLGGRAIRLTGKRVADEVLSYSRQNNVTHIAIGKSSRSWWFELVNGSIVHDLVAKSGEISVHVIAGTGKVGPSAPRGDGTAEVRRREPWPYVASALMVTAATVLGFGLQHLVGIPNVSLVFLMAVLFSAIRFGRPPAILATVLSAASYNFFFLPPAYTFTIADPTDLRGFFFFFLVAILATGVTAQVQRRSYNTAQRVRSTEELYAFSRKLAGIGTLDDLLWAVVYQIASMLQAQVVVLLPQDGAIEVSAAYPPEDELDQADLAAAQWTWSRNHAAGRGSDTLPGAKRLFLPMQTERGPIGVVGFERARLLAPDERRLLDALLDQAAVAIERIRLVNDVEEAELQAETERLRNALLTSVSHDLRTPLATIIGALTSLKEFGEHYDSAVREELLASSLDEADRLNRFVGNLLDMTRLEAGGLTPRRDAIDLADAVGATLNRAARLMAAHRVEIDLRDDLPPVAVDAVLLEQVMFNLLDNAAKYAPTGTTIQITAHEGEKFLSLSVIDEGPGIPENALDKIFDKFTRLDAGDRKRVGTGLGLQIARGFVRAMGGTIRASNRQDRSGAIFTMTLPLAATQAAPAQAPLAAAVS